MSRPAIVFVHYHLRRGGVSKIITETSKALTRNRVDHLILSGDPGPHEHLPSITLPELDYAEPASMDPQALANKLSDVVQNRLQDRPVIWHVHNPALGKNPILTEALGVLAARQERMVLHHHDFAEEGRPANLKALSRTKDAYPHSGRVLHAFINSRDRLRLIAAGLPQEQAILLRNPITSSQVFEPSGASSPCVFLPIRGIPRKNLGETLLLAAGSGGGAEFFVSRAPTETRWLADYRRWAELIEELGLPVELDAASKAPFENWIRKSTHLMTNSVVEGFGLAHLEAIQWQRPLIGRELPHLQQDLPLTDKGRFYHALRVPSEWLDMPLLRAETRATLAAHGYPSDEESVMLALGAAPDPDFGRLPAMVQSNVIRRVAAGDTGIRAMTRSSEQPLEQWMRRQLKDRSLSVSADQLDGFKMSAYIQSLTDLYQRMTAQPMAQPSFLDRAKVLEQFRDPADFQFICV